MPDEYLGVESAGIWDYSNVASVRYLPDRPDGFLIVHYGTPPFNPDRRFIQYCHWWWFDQPLHSPGPYPATELERLGLSTYPRFIPRDEALQLNLL